MKPFDLERVFAAPATQWHCIREKATETLLKTYPKALKSPTALPMRELFEGGLMKSLGIGYGVEDLSDCEGYFAPDRNEIILSGEAYSALLDGQRRARFTVAHELGHAILHRGYVRDITTFRREPIFFSRSQLPPWQNIETQANVFAAEFLMPAHHVMMLLEEGSTPEQLAEVFKVSVQSAEIRASVVYRK